MRSRFPAALIAALALTSTTAITLPALADDAAASAQAELPVTVLTVLTPDAFDLADALTVALKRAVEDTPGYTASEKEQVLQVLVLTLGCGDPAAPPGTVVPDGPCEVKIAERIQADRYVWARIKKKGAVVAGDLHFVQRGLPTQSAPLEYSSNLNDGSDVTLIAIAKAALEKAGAGSPIGKVKVFAGKVTGQAFIDGKKVGDVIDGRGDFDATSGTHKLVLRTTAGVEITSEFKLSPLGEATVLLNPPGPPTRGFDGKIAVGFGLVAIGLGFGAGGLYSTVRLHGIQNDFDDHYKSHYAKGDDACNSKAQPLPLDHNKVLELCKDSSTLKATQFAFYPIAAVAAGVGFTLLGIANWHPDKPATSAALDFEPWVSPEGGALSVRGQF